MTRKPNYRKLVKLDSREYAIWSIAKDLFGEDSHLVQRVRRWGQCPDEEGLDRQFLAAFCLDLSEAVSHWEACLKEHEG